MLLDWSALFLSADLIKGGVLVFIGDYNVTFSLFSADIMIAHFSMSTEILWTAFGEWAFGNTACKAINYVQCFLLAGTAFTIISMSYDQYRAVCCQSSLQPPVRNLLCSRRMMVVSWTLAFLVALPQVFIFLQVTTKEHNKFFTFLNVCAYYHLNRHTRGKHPFTWMWRLLISIL